MFRYCKLITRCVVAAVTERSVVGESDSIRLLRSVNVLLGSLHGPSNRIVEVEEI